MMPTLANPRAQHVLCLASNAASGTPLPNRSTSLAALASFADLQNSRPVEGHGTLDGCPVFHRLKGDERAASARPRKIGNGSQRSVALTAGGIAPQAMD